MTLKDTYKLPEGTNAFFRFTPSFFDTVDAHFTCPPNMTKAFYYYGGNSLPALDFSNVTNMYYMCAYCENVSYINVSNWDTSNVTNMTYLFNYCKNISTLDLSNWNISQVTSLNQMFSNCSNLKSIDVSNWDTSKVTSMSYMFSNCSNLTLVNGMETWDTSKVNDFNNMFYSTKVETIPPLNAQGVTSSNKAGMFSSSNGSDYLKNFGGWIGLKHSVTSYGIEKCKNLTYQSCINVLNGLYDFTTAGETPTSTQGKLKVHQNFLDLVGEEISIGTNKGWTITA